MEGCLNAQSTKLLNITLVLFPIQGVNCENNEAIFFHLKLTLIGCLSKREGFIYLQIVFLELSRYDLKLN